jgi:hypothetical protein
MRSKYSFRSSISFGRRLTLRSAALAGLVLCALFVLHRGKPLRADAPPAATLVSPNGGTVRIGKPYFLWNADPLDREKKRYHAGPVQTACPGTHLSIIDEVPAGSNGRRNDGRSHE